MAASTYNAFIDRMIKKYEGGYGWNKKDTGGPTKYGITCFDLAQHMGLPMDSMSKWAPMVQSMTLETAEKIYKTKYANALHYDELNPGIDTEVMDYGVNSGVGRPILSLRAILGIPGRAVMDAALIKAANAQDPKKLIAAISAERLHFMQNIRGGSAWKEFGRGWAIRVADLKAYSLNLADKAHPVPVAPDLSTISMPKAVNGLPNTTVNTIKTTSIGAAGTATTAHASGLSPAFVLTLTGITIGAGVAYAIYANHKAAALNAAVAPPIRLAPVAPVAA